MPATGLKTVVTGECLPWCSISSSFQNLFFEDVWASRLRVSGVFVLEFGPIFAWYSAAKEFVVVFDAFYI